MVSVCRHQKGFNEIMFFPSNSAWLWFWFWLLHLVLSITGSQLHLIVLDFTSEFQNKWFWCEDSGSISTKSTSFLLTVCSCVAVEVKKEPEPPTEAVKQEEREPATKSSAPAPPSKPPPEKRARLQWAEQSHTQGRWSKASPTALTERTAWEYFCSLTKLCEMVCHSARLISLQEAKNELAQNVSVACLSARTTFTL